MNILALDTSSPACSVALQLDDGVVERYEIKPRQHARLLLPMIRSVLDECDVRVAELNAIVLGNGPGSFIGMRIAASVAQGLAYGTGLNIIPVSSLAAVAAEVLHHSAADHVVVAQDAHMNEVYLGIFARDEHDRPRLVGDERLHPQSTIEVLSRDTAMCRAAAGQGWQRYPKLLARNRDLMREVSTVLYPRARFLLDIARLDEAVTPANISPAYLRKKVAEKTGCRGE